MFEFNGLFLERVNFFFLVLFVFVFFLCLVVRSVFNFRQAGQDLFTTRTTFTLLAKAVLDELSENKRLCYLKVHFASVQCQLL